MPLGRDKIRFKGGFAQRTVLCTMDMISPVRADWSKCESVAGRPYSERTLEIIGELRLAEALGRFTVTMPLLDVEAERFERFSSRARIAGKSIGRKVRVRRVSEKSGEVTLLEG